MNDYDKYMRLLAGNAFMSLLLAMAVKSGKNTLGKLTGIASIVYGGYVVGISIKDMWKFFKNKLD